MPSKDPYKPREPKEGRSTPSDENKNRQGNGDPPGPQPPNMKFNRGIFGWLLLIGLAIVIFVFMSQMNSQEAQTSWAEFQNYVQDDRATKIVVKDDRVVATVKETRADGPPTKLYFVPISAQTKESTVQWLREHAADKYEEQPGGNLFFNLLIGLGPWIIFFVLIWFIFFRAMRGAGGGMGMLGSFGRSRHKMVSKEMTNITLNDVAGIDEAKEEVGEIIEFLRNPKKFQRLGGRVPRGVLLSGQPGCGKTLLAKAVAGEAEVPFFSISGSDFVEMFVGVGASRVRDLFKQAKDNSPCIIFLDEIDAVGRRRGSGFSGGGGHDEREQTLNAILVEMDGFDTNDQVIVIAATNRPDVLDPALTRPGRFDRQIAVPLPDIKGRLEILNVHAKKIKLSPDINMEKLARGTPMFSGADLAAIINEAAIIATLADKEYVEMADLEEARDKVRFGKSYKSRKLEEEERIGTAYHEAGHTVVQMLLDHADPLHKVTILPRGKAMGATFSLPEKDRYGYGERYISATLRVLCAGRIAEQRKTGDLTSGASGDIRMATTYARHMVLEWGMSDQLGFVLYGEDENQTPLPQKTYSDETARIIDSEIKRIISEAYEETVELVDKHWQQVEVIAQALLKFESLSREEVDKLMAGETLRKPTVSELIDAEARKRKQNDADQASKPSPQPNENADTDTGGPMPSPA